MDRDAELALLASLRTHHAELNELLASSDHWGFEDPVYRFYHQSFKVYSLQERTSAIVGALTRLAPDRTLNPMFLEIIAGGTGKTDTEPAAERLRVASLSVRPSLNAHAKSSFTRQRKPAGCV